MKALLALSFLLLLHVAAPASVEGEIRTVSETTDHLQRISVTIKAGTSSGSGVLFVREVGGESMTFVWTAAHVIDNLRTAKKMDEHTHITFGEPSIVQELVRNGEMVGEIKMTARVIKYSNAEDGHDLALLLVNYHDFAQKGVTFADDELVPIGTELYHVGSLLGQQGANSLTTGIISQVGRMLDQKVYDQTSATAFPGSSGGGIFLKDGTYVGMLVRGAGEGFNLMVPIRRIWAWAHDQELEWAVDPTVEAPLLSEILDIEVDDQHSGEVKRTQAEMNRIEELNSEFPFLINEKDEEKEEEIPAIIYPQVGGLPMFPLIIR